MVRRLSQEPEEGRGALRLGVRTETEKICGVDGRHLAPIQYSKGSMQCKIGGGGCTAKPLAKTNTEHLPPSRLYYMSVSWGAAAFATFE